MIQITDPRIEAYLMELQPENAPALIAMEEKAEQMRFPIIDRLVGSGIWEIPVGRKRKFGAGWHPALNFIAGGWQLSGLYQHQSGAPQNLQSVATGNMTTIKVNYDRKAASATAPEGEVPRP